MSNIQIRGALYTCITHLRALVQPMFYDLLAYTSLERGLETHRLKVRRGHRR